MIRVGNDDYAKQNGSYGLTTLKNRHASVNGSQVRFRFTGKGGRQWSLSLRERRIARIIRARQELPGQELLQYLGDEGRPQDVTSSDVNDYLRRITGHDITAKDFRTWPGPCSPSRRCNICRHSPARQAKRNLRAAIQEVVARLGNTPTICRKCYVHPQAMSAYIDGSLMRRLEAPCEQALHQSPDGLCPEEAAALALIRSGSALAPNAGHVIAREISGPGRSAGGARRRPRSPSQGRSGQMAWATSANGCRRPAASRNSR